MGFRVVSTSWLGVRAKLNAVDKALRMVLLCFSLEHARGIPAGGDGLHLGRGESTLPPAKGASGQDGRRLQPGWRDGGA